MVRGAAEAHPVVSGNPAIRGGQQPMTITPARHAAWTLLTLAVIACGAEDAAEPDTAALRLEEVSRFGSMEGEGTAFTSISGVALTDSTILVLESQPPRVAVLGFDGTWQRDIGRAGDGPGELVGPDQIGIVGDTLWVGDLRGRRVELYGPTGTSVASYRWTIPPDSLGVPVAPRVRLADGSILAGHGGVSIGAIVNGLVDHFPYVRATPTGEVLGEVYRERVAPDDFVRADIGEGRVALGVHPLRYGPLVAFRPDGSGLVVVERPQAEAVPGARFRIRAFDASGAQTLDLEVPYEPVSAEGWRDAYARGLEEDMTASGRPVDRTFLSALIEAPVDRRFQPSVTAVKAGPDGSIWVRREETEAASVRWQLFTGEGALRGALSIPKDTELIRVGLEEVWAVEKNEFDVPFLLRMRVLD
jgi:hypothetical protein